MGWAEYLDELEARLHGHEAALANGEPAPAELMVSEDLGPLPEPLAARAGAILERTQRLEALVLAERSAVARVLTGSLAAAPQRQSAVYLDVRA